MSLRRNDDGSFTSNGQNFATMGAYVQHEQAQRAANAQAPSNNTGPAPASGGPAPSSGGGGGGQQPQYGPTPNGLPALNYSPSVDVNSGYWLNVGDGNGPRHFFSEQQANVAMQNAQRQGYNPSFTTQPQGYNAANAYRGELAYDPSQDPMQGAYDAAYPIFTRDNPQFASPDAFRDHMAGGGMSNMAQLNDAQIMEVIESLRGAPQQEPILNEQGQLMQGGPTPELNMDAIMAMKALRGNRGSNTVENPEANFDAGNYEGRSGGNTGSDNSTPDPQQEYSNILNLPQNLLQQLGMSHLMGGGNVELPVGGQQALPPSNSGVEMFGPSVLKPNVDWRELLSPSVLKPSTFTGR